MRFTKMQGLGNDYVYVNCFEEVVEEPEQTARAVCDRHFGIGADGLILIQPSNGADCRMEMYNADGSRGAMCGNGIRCVAKYVYEAGLVKSPRISVETDSGIRKVFCRVREGKVFLADVEMGIPVVGERELLEAGGSSYSFTPVELGNPHAVLFYSEIDGLDLRKIGPLIGKNSRFPGGVNVGFAKVDGCRSLKLRVWERGTGETMACGTGACAACAAAISMGFLKRKATVRLPGGDLEVTWAGPAYPMVMTGPAREVYRGEITL